jgi:hypothetical protein
MIFSLTRGDRMGKSYTKGFVFTLGLLSALLILTMPVCAVDGTITITYRGAGGNYLGESVIFDGINTLSNVTVLKMTGPGLPAEGVPIYNVNGDTGSGNTVPVNADGTWKLVWYTNTIKGVEKLQTARYYITAFDLVHPEKSMTTSILLKRPDFYMDISPSSASLGDYVQLTGISEKGTGIVHFEVLDESGTMVRSYDASVSGSGYFNKGFHVDLPPGIYTVKMSSPSVKNIYAKYLTINAPVSGTPAPVVTGNIENPDKTTPVVPVVTAPVPGAAGIGSLSLSSAPSGVMVYVDSVLMGTTPTTLSSVPAGNHLIEFKSPGYVTNAVQVTVKSGDTITMSPTLVKNPSAIPLSVLTVIAGVFISFAVMVTYSKYRKN